MSERDEELEAAREPERLAEVSGKVAKIVGWLACLVVLSVLLLTVRAVRDIGRLGKSEPVSMVEVGVQKPSLVRSPGVILVLDVSGSMRANDPRGEQAQAVRSFLHAYHALVQDSLAPGEAASLAVVLFGTVAQPLAWPASQGGSGVWLRLSSDEQSTTKAAEVITRFIEPREGHDPRNGHFTDYAAALSVVSRLLVSPGAPRNPCVLFMTDGKDEPLWPVAAAKPEARRVIDARWHESVEKLIADYYPDDVVTAQRTRDAARSLLGSLWSTPASVAAGGEVTDPVSAWTAALGPSALELLKRSLKPVSELQGAIMEERDRRIEAEVAGLATWHEQASDRGSVFWQSIYLVTTQSDEATSAVTSNRVENALALNRPPAICREAAEMEGRFLSVLDEWLGLDHQVLAPATREVLVDPQTAGLALSLQIPASAQGVRLLDPKGVPHLLTSGSQDQNLSTWTLCLAEPPAGRWLLESSAPVSSGMLWSRRRYLWLCDRFPQVVSPLSTGAFFRLALYDAREGRLTDAAAVYAATSLPSNLTARLTFLPSEGIELDFHKMRSDEGTFYEASAPDSLPRAPSAGAELRCTISGLLYAEGAVPAAACEVDQLIDIRGGVDLRLSRGDGQWVTGIDLRGLVPGMTSAVGRAMVAP